MSDKSSQVASATPSFPEAFNFIFQWWFIVFVLILIPVDFIYRFSSLSAGMAGLQIAASLVTLVFFFTVASLGIALASCAVGLPLRLFLPQTGYLIMEVNALLGLWVLIVVILDYYWKFTIHFFGLWDLMFSFRIATGLVILSIVVFIIISYFFRSKLLRKIRSFTTALFIFNIAIAAISIMGTLVLLSSNLYHRHQRALYQADVEIPGFRPNIILITFDALCAQHTSVYGYPRDTTPNMQALAGESYVFDHAYAAANWTTPAVSSLIIGKYPFNHKIVSECSFLLGREQTENLPFILKGLGYKTMAVVANQFAAPYQRNLVGFDKISLNFANSCFLVAVVNKYFYRSGLGTMAWLSPMLQGSIVGIAVKGLSRVWQESFHKAGLSREEDRSLGFSAPESTFGEATQYMKTAREPFFIWVHLWPPHDPYAPSKKFLYSFLAERIYDGPEVLTSSVAPDNTYPTQDQPLIDKLALRYDEYILDADHELGKFLAGLKKSGLLDRSILMVSADHGEMFEKGFCSHGGPYLYQPLIHIPFILHLPKQTRGQRLGATISQVDVAPTLLDLLGMAIPPWMEGQSFKKALKGLPYQPKLKFSMNLTLSGDSPKFQTKSIAVIQDNYKLINYLKFHRYEMFDLQKDPHELNNIVQSQLAIFAKMKKELEGILPQ